MVLGYGLIVFKIWQPVIYRKNLKSFQTILSEIKIMHTHFSYVRVAMEIYK